MRLLVSVEQAAFFGARASKDYQRVGGEELIDRNPLAPTGRRGARAAGTLRLVGIVTEPKAQPQLHIHPVQLRQRHHPDGLRVQLHSVRADHLIGPSVQLDAYRRRDVADAGRTASTKGSHTRTRLV